jgi:thiol-disulfide isomerase/thioredoxin
VLKRTIAQRYPTVTQTKAADAVQSLRFIFAPLIAVALMAALLFGVGSSAQSIWSSADAQPASAPSAPASLPAVQSPSTQAASVQADSERGSDGSSPPSVEPLPTPRTAPADAPADAPDLVAVVDGEAISTALVAQARSIDLAMSSLLGLPPTAAGELVQGAINHRLVLQKAAAANFAATDTPARLAELLAANGKTETDLQAVLHQYNVERDQFEAYLADLMTVDQFARQEAQQQGTTLEAYLSGLRRLARISYGPAATAPMPPVQTAAAAEDLVLASTPPAPTPLPTPPAKALEERGVLVGQLAPLFSLDSLAGSSQSDSGGPVTIEDLEGTPTVLSFWTTWCPYCLLQTPILVAGAQRYAEQPLRFVGIDVGENQDVVAGYAGQHAIPYLVLLDRQSQVAGDYAVSGYPTTYFLDADGRIVAHHIGALTEEQLDQYIEQLLATRS